MANHKDAALIDELKKLVRKAFFEGFSNGLYASESLTGGPEWEASFARQDLSALDNADE